MAHKGGIHSAVPIELLLKWKNNQCLRDVFAQQLHATLAPRPKLRADVVHHGNTAFMHLPRHPPIESWRVNDKGQVRWIAVSLRDQLAVAAINLRQVADNFGYPNHRKVLGID